MDINPATIERLIQEEIPDAKVRAMDIRGDGSYYTVHVTSEKFAGLRRVDQHRMVYHALFPHIREDVHAIQLSTSAG